jgi:uroporphyrinogen-III synthase
VLVLRPEPGASETAARAAATGLAVIKAPLFTIAPRPWTIGRAPGPVIATSANALRHGGAALAALTGRRLYAVGAATARAARAAGFADIVTGPGDAAALVPLLRADGVTAALRLAGADHVAIDPPEIRIATRIVYAAEAATALPPAAAAALRDGFVALVHSPAAGRLLAALREDDGVPITVAAISAAAAAACGTIARRIVVADAPRDDALLAAAARLCDQACPSGDDSDEDHGRDRG